MDTRALSQQKTAHALRHFVMCGALWAIYGPNATAAGAIFSGFALDIGLKEAQIAFLVSLSSLAGVSQMVSFYVTRRVRNRRLFMVALGQVEITAASCIVLMGLVAPHFRFGGVAVLLVTAYLIGHTVSPLFNSWLSNVIPEDVRATYTGRRMFILTVTSMVYLYLASLWIDNVPGLKGFALVFGIGWIAGLAGYWLLLVTPLPQIPVEEGSGFARSLSEPWRNRGFAVLALFVCTWTVAMQVAGAFYGIYMIKYLDLTYSRIAIYTNITLFCMIGGYLLAGPIAQRYGSKPVAQLLVVPGMAVPILWMFTTLENYATVIPVACVISGLSIAGLSVATSSLLYKIVPRGVDNSLYFASWTGLWALASAAGPFVGGNLRNWLPEHTVIGSLDFTPLQVIFGVSGALYVFPTIVSALLVESDATSPRYLLGQFRGNLLSFAYNSALYTVARQEGTKAHAIRGLGRSRTPLAVNPLLRALGHTSHEVRSQAAKGLGDGQFSEALSPLMEALEDESSDIRPEAAQALGKIGGETASEILFRALEDPDIRVRTSAVLAMGDLSDDEAHSVLVRAISGQFDRGLFPTLVDAATRKPDLSLVEPIMERLGLLDQPVVRMQVLNGVCRLLGEKNHFYRLANSDNLQRAALSEPMMQRIRRLITTAAREHPEPAAELAILAGTAQTALADDDLGGLAQAARAISEKVLSAPDQPPVARNAATAITMYLDEGRFSLLRPEGIVFVTIALTALARSLAGRHPQDGAKVPGEHPARLPELADEKAPSESPEN